MLNNLKMDVYRMTRQKSFYVALGVLLFLFAWMLCSTGTRSDTMFASFNRKDHSTMDFLYYFPKSTIFIIGVMVFLSLFSSEEYDSGFVKNFYPLQQKKWKLLLEKWIFSFLVYAIYWVAIVGLSLLINVWVQDPFLSFSVKDYLLFSLMQAILLGAAGSFVSMVTHCFQNKIASVMIAVAYGGAIFFVLHTGICELLPQELSYYEQTLYYISGTLPYTFDAEVYGKAFAIAISSTILYNGISYIILKKKDIA